MERRGTVRNPFRVKQLGLLITFFCKRLDIGKFVAGVTPMYIRCIYKKMFHVKHFHVKQISTTQNHRLIQNHHQNLNLEKFQIVFQRVILNLYESYVKVNNDTQTIFHSLICFE